MALNDIEMKRIELSCWFHFTLETCDIIKEVRDDLLAKQDLRFYCTPMIVSF